MSSRSADAMSRRKLHLSRASPGQGWRAQAWEGPVLAVLLSAALMGLPKLYCYNLSKPCCCCLGCNVPWNCCKSLPCVSPHAPPPSIPFLHLWEISTEPAAVALLDNFCFPRPLLMWTKLNSLPSGWGPSLWNTRGSGVCSHYTS